MIDVAIVGAGLAGLTCAQQLQRGGYQVAVLEKSRGLGGRVATRRLGDTCADQGARSLAVQGHRSQALIQTLCDRHILQVWTDQQYELSPTGEIQLQLNPALQYAPPQGMTAIAKELAHGLTIHRQQRVICLTPTQPAWIITLESPESALPDLQARAVCLAIPAPQIVDLLHHSPIQQLSPAFLTTLQSVEFQPCISAIALYSRERETDLARLPWASLLCPAHPQISWIGLDSRKRSPQAAPVIAIQSNAHFASAYLTASDLTEAGQFLLEQAAAMLLQSWIAVPDEMYVHRWRYAFPHRPLPASFLGTEQPLPLACTGDWCGGLPGGHSGATPIEAALESGWAAAQHLDHLLDQRLSAAPSLL